MRKIIARTYSIIKSFFSQKRPEYKLEQFGSIGPHCIIGSNSRLVPQNIYMEDYSIIQGNNNFISFNGKLIIKKYSVISSGCIIIPSNHIPTVGVPFYGSTLTHIGDDDNVITIEEDAWIGAGSILLPHCKIGRGCIVGAGSVVTKDIPPYAVVVGCPARIVGVKFSKEDIIEHEKRIYNSSDRMPLSVLDDLFYKYYNEVQSGIKHKMTSEEVERYRLFEKQYNLLYD